MKNFNFEIVDETMNDTNNLIVQDTVQENVQEWKYSEFYKMYELEYGYYFKISRKSVFYFPYSEFSNEAIPKLNEIFRKNGIIIQKSYK